MCSWRFDDQHFWLEWWSRSMFLHTRCSLRSLHVILSESCFFHTLCWIKNRRIKSRMKNIKRENKTISFSRLIFLIRLLIRRLIIVSSTSKFDQSTKDTTINTIDTSVHLYMMSTTNLSSSYKKVNQLNDLDQDWLQLLRRSSFLIDYMRNKDTKTKRDQNITKRLQS
jgi:hypothetical protein